MKLTNQTESAFFQCERCRKLHMKSFPGPTRACSCGECFPWEYMRPRDYIAVYPLLPRAT